MTLWKEHTSEVPISFSPVLCCCAKGRLGRNFLSKTHFRSHWTWKGFHWESLCDLEVPGVLLCLLGKMAWWQPCWWLEWTDSSSWRGKVKGERYFGPEKRAALGLMEDEEWSPWLLLGCSLAGTCQGELNLAFIMNQKDPKVQLQGRSSGANCRVFALHALV